MELTEVLSGDCSNKRELTLLFTGIFLVIGWLYVQILGMDADLELMKSQNIEVRVDLANISSNILRVQRDLRAISRIEVKQGISTRNITE